MSDLSRSSGSSSTNGVVETPVEGSDVPAWLRARRSRIPVPQSASQGSAEVRNQSESPEAPIVTTSADTCDSLQDDLPGVSEGIPAANPQILDSQAPSSPTRKEGPVQSSLPRTRQFPFPKIDNSSDKGESTQGGLKARISRWLHSAATAGVLFSCFVHSLGLSTLAVIYFHVAAKEPAVEIYAGLNDPNDSTSEIGLESALTEIVPGKEAAQTEFTDLTQVMTGDLPSFDAMATLRGSSGGSGRGNGTGSNTTF